MTEPVPNSMEKDDKEKESSLCEKMQYTEPKYSTHSTSFFQIRKRFEEKHKTSCPSTQKETVSLNTEAVSDFQKLYPLFKCSFTKRQFTAMENSFNMADRNHDGFLEPKEMKQLLVDHQQPINLCDADSIVSMGDKNHDGKLSPKEFLELCMPAAAMLREEQLNQGCSSLVDKEFVISVLRQVRKLVSPPPVNIKVKGTRSFFESIISGGTTNETENTSLPKRNVADKYLETLSCAQK